MRLESTRYGGEGRTLMNEPIGTDGLVDTETALLREVELLAQRFPDVDRETLDRYVHEIYAELSDHAAVKAHLVAITEAQVTERLLAEGQRLQVRGSEQP